LESTGWSITVEELIQEIVKDLAFFDQSGGGVTFSGGEPLMQPEFLLALLNRCGELGIHRTVDTSGYCDAATIQDVAEQTDLFLFDLKHLNKKRHKQVTGVENGIIINNLRLLAEMGQKIRLRLPLINNINDDLPHIKEVASFIRQLSGVEDIDLLPYHASARAKYAKLDLAYDETFAATPSRQHIDDIVRILQQQNLNVTVGG
jgi:pyruvate formate lyase activating enzyme